MKNHINKKIFWIASYPKSGNTWMRAILLSLFFTKDGIFNFKLFNQIRYFDTPGNYEFIKSLNLNDFKNLNDLSTIAKYWIEAQKRTIITDGNFSFYKTHSANMSLYNNEFTNTNNSLGFLHGVLWDVTSARASNVLLRAFPHFHNFIDIVNQVS